MPGMARSSTTTSRLRARRRHSSRGTDMNVSFRVNGSTRELSIDSRVSLLDSLRDELGLTGTKKGCDQGACGACTVIVDGQRVLSCLTLAVACEGQRRHN